MVHTRMPLSVWLAGFLYLAMVVVALCFGGCALVTDDRCSDGLTARHDDQLGWVCEGFGWNSSRWQTRLMGDKRWVTLSR